MSQQSEERVPEQVASPATSARVLPFERPQSDLQKAVQQRAQEAIDLERDRAASRKTPAWRRALVLVLAAIPVVLTFGAAIGFVGALRQFNARVFESAPAEQTAPTDRPAVNVEPTVADPDVVILQPLNEPARPKNDSSQSNAPRK